MERVENVKQLRNVIAEINAKYGDVFKAAGHNVSILDYIRLNEKDDSFTIDIIKQIPNKAIYDDLIKCFTIGKASL